MSATASSNATPAPNPAATSAADSAATPAAAPAATAATSAAATAVPAPPGPFKSFWQDFSRNRGALTGLYYIVATLLIAVFAALMGDRSCTQST